MGGFGFGDFKYYFWVCLSWINPDTKMGGVVTGWENVWSRCKRAWKRENKEQASTELPPGHKGAHGQQSTILHRVISHAPLCNLNYRLLPTVISGISMDASSQREVFQSLSLSSRHIYCTSSQIHSWLYSLLWMNTFLLTFLAGGVNINSFPCLSCTWM